MDLDLFRYRPTLYSIGGKLAVNGVFECYSLERPYADPEHKPVPAGRYNVQVFMSPHFQKNIPHILNVPGREAIEIHMGNHVSETHGCVLVGQQLGEDEIYTSLLALSILTGKLERLHEPIYINIYDSLKENTNEKVA